MVIYQSSKVLPYVYQCIHKITGKIYIGSRVANNQFSHLDLPKYRTSSKYVKPIFDEFDWFIVAEFFDKHDAYDFEQQLIHEQWQISKEMSLNRYHHYGKKSWNTIDLKPSEEHKRKIGDALRGIKHTKEHIKKVSDALKGILKSEECKQKMRKPKSEEHKHNMRKPRPSLKDKPKSEEHKRKIGDFFRGKPGHKTKIIDVLTPDGFVIENTTMKELCSQFNFVYKTLAKHFKNNKPHKGFIKL